MRPRLALVLVTFALLSPSCGGMGDAVDPNHCRDTYCVGGDMSVTYMATRPTRVIDILLVVDDHVVSSPDVPKLELALTRMMENLDWPLQLGWYPIDLNVAMVSAATADATASTAPPTMWPASPSCANPSGPFLRATQLCDDGSNFSGSLSEAVACAALHLPASGGSPGPIDTIRAVLAAGGPAESIGFRREGVPLIVAIVSTEDDPLLSDSDAVAAAHDLLASAASDPEAAVLVGVVAPTGAHGLIALAKAFGDNGEFSAVTDTVWTSLPFTTDLRLAVDGWPGYRDCLDWPVVDAQPDVDGIQPDCVATEIHLSSTERTEEILPPCSDNASVPDRCWRPERNPNPCPAGEFEFLVEPRVLACLPNYSIRFALTCAVRYD